MFLCSEFLVAVGVALYSGVFMAWLVDFLKAEDIRITAPLTRLIVDVTLTLELKVRHHAK